MIIELAFWILLDPADSGAVVAGQTEDITLHIEQRTQDAGQHTIQLALERPGEPRLTARADIEFALTPQEHADLRWYLEDYLVRAESVTTEHVDQIAGWMKARGEELYRKVLPANDNTQNLWSSVRNDLAKLRVEITTSVAVAVARKTSNCGPL